MPEYRSIDRNKDPDKVWHSDPNCYHWKNLGNDDRAEVKLTRPNTGRMCKKCGLNRPGFAGD